MDDPSVSLWRRFVRTFDRAVAAAGNSRLVRLITRNHATPDLDLTLCIERLALEDPRELVIALRWLRSMHSPSTSRAAGRVRGLLQHADPEVRDEAEQTREVMLARFGPGWLQSS